MIRRGLIAVLPLFCAACGQQGGTPSETVIDGNPDAGRAVIARIDCGVCHVIPGVAGARGTVGPSLARFAERSYIAGTAPNTPAMLVQWLQDAPAIAPDTAMPDLPLTTREARDVAAYLYGLR